MPKTFDLVVIGTGSAASTAAYHCRAAGWQVAIIDSRPFGGTCALRGCDPKKVLVGAAEAIDWNRRMKGKGIDGGQARIAWADLMRFKRSFTEPVPGNREQGFSKAGMVAFSRSLALEEARHGITVNVVNPPIIDEKELSLEEAERVVDARFPVGRPATAQDVAEAVKFFAAEESSFVTGQVLNVTGGWML